MFPTVAAFVGTLARMESDVHLVGHEGGESVSAVFTNVRFLSRVGHTMPFQSLRPDKSLATILTFVGLLVGMDL